MTEYERGKKAFKLGEAPDSSESIGWNQGYNQAAKEAQDLIDKKRVEFKVESALYFRILSPLADSFFGKKAAAHLCENLKKFGIKYRNECLLSTLLGEIFVLKTTLQRYVIEGTQREEIFGYLERWFPGTSCPGGEEKEQLKIEGK